MYGCAAATAVSAVCVSAALSACHRWAACSRRADGGSLAGAGRPGGRVMGSVETRAGGVSSCCGAAAVAGVAD